MQTTDTQQKRLTSTADDDLAFAGLPRLSDMLGGGHVSPRELTEF